MDILKRLTVIVTLSSIFAGGWQASFEVPGGAGSPSDTGSIAILAPAAPDPAASAGLTLGALPGIAAGEQIAAPADEQIAAPADEQPEAPARAGRRGGAGRNLKN